VFAKKVMKVQAEAAIWLQNVRHQLTVDTTQFVTKESVNVIEDMKETVLTCE
jgi:hypothetical protein